MQPQPNMNNQVSTLPWAQHFTAVEKVLPGAGSPWLVDLRRAALGCFQDQGFPTRRWEEWHYTDLSALAATTFRPNAGGVLARENEKDLLDYLLGSTELSRVVFVNGAWAPGVSALHPSPPGVHSGSLAAALTEAPERLRTQLGSAAGFREHPLVALNTAFMTDGFHLHLPPGTVMEEPIHLVFLSAPDGAPSVTHPRVLVVAGEGSRVSLIESYLGSGQGAYFTNSVTEILAAPGAVVEHYKIQEEGAEAFHLGSIRVRQQRDSQVTCHLVSLGGRLVRNETFLSLEGPGARGVLNGLLVAGGQQRMDNHTLIDHREPEGTSRELYKSVLDGRASGTFSGRIVVHPDAQRTDAAQTNRNLLLSDDAVANSRPQLEIYADDVKCSHGATSGQLDRDAVFYLRTRGIDREAARIMLTRAFVDEIIDLVRLDGLRAHLHRRIDGRVAPDKLVKEAV